MITPSMPPGTPTKSLYDHSFNSLSVDHILQDSSHNNNNNSSTTSISSLPKHGHAVPPLLSYSSLTLPDGHVTANNQSLLTPSSLYIREHRLNASPSFDASLSQSARRRVRRNSSTCGVDHDDKNNITLLTFAKAAHIVYAKLAQGVRRAVSTLFVSRPRGRQLVNRSDIVEQAHWICTDYILNKLTSKKLMSRKVGLSAPGWSKSVHVINAALSLELTYPRTYSNVSRKLCMTMSSPKVVRTTLTSLLTVLFESGITWGKVVSMFAVAGLFGEECAIQGHADFVKEVVDVVADFTRGRLLQWLVSQGGWDAFPLPNGSERSRLSKLRLLLLTGGTSVLLLAGCHLLDVC
ncbi:hypothetical protein BsWGS_09719 [Bradybaena similaris]